MQKPASEPAPQSLDEFKLRDELRSLRTRIPDEPQLNPILNVAFDLSRRLESGQVSLAGLKGLAARLMDRAAARRAIRLRERIGYGDTSVTLKEFQGFVEETLGGGPDPEGGVFTMDEALAGLPEGTGPLRAIITTPVASLASFLTRQAASDTSMS